MAQINWTDYEEPGGRPDLLPIGLYSVVCTKAVERDAKSGDAMFDLTLESTQFQRLLCYDVVMLAGRGKNMGLAKLKQMGLGDKTEIHDIDLEGLKFIVCVERDDYTRDDGKVVERLGVALNFNDPFRAGYAPKEAYAELEPDLVKLEVEDTPF